MFPSESIEVPSLEANLEKQEITEPRQHVHRPVGQRVGMLGARAVRHVVKYQHHLVDEHDEASEEEPAGQL